MSSQTTLTNWDQRFGNLKGSRCLARQSAQNSTSHRRWKNVWPKRGSRGQRSRQCQICSVLGSFCSKAQTLGRTTPCAPLHPSVSAAYCHAPCWMESPQRMRQKASSCQHSQCGWAVLGCGQQRGAHPLRTGRRGQMLCTSAHTRCSPRRAAQTKSGGTCRRMFGRVDASSELDRKGFWWRPSWPELHEGKRPPKTEIREPGEWPHGWQYWASSVLDTSFRKSSMLIGRPPSHQAQLRTHSGLNAGIVFAHAPTTPECTVPPHLFRVLLLERLNLPFPITEAVCNGCHEPLDAHGQHRAVHSIWSSSEAGHPQQSACWPESAAKLVLG